MTLESLSPDHQHLVNQVQFNCDISDANHAGNFTLCIYLLKMREYYRWMQALDYSDTLDNEHMGQWLREKEEIWDQVVDEPFQPIAFNGQSFDPFDHQAINSQINEQKLFYHAGIGQKAAHHFFLSELIDHYEENGIKINITGTEFARDLTAPPALSNGQTMVIRQQSLQRMCWERYQEWNWSRLENPMGKALSFYPFEQSIDRALDLMVANETASVIQHELGEIIIGREYGDSWRAMMTGLLGSRAELMARALRDHFADSLTTLPWLCEQDNPASLHFYFANLTHLRKQMYPTAMDAYRRWTESEDISIISDLAQQSQQHWRQCFESVLEIASATEQNAEAEIIQCIEAATL